MKMRVREHYSRRCRVDRETVVHCLARSLRVVPRIDGERGASCSSAITWHFMVTKWYRSAAAA